MLVSKTEIFNMFLQSVVFLLRSYARQMHPVVSAILRRSVPIGLEDCKTNKIIRTRGIKKRRISSFYTKRKEISMALLSYRLLSTKMVKIFSSILIFLKLIKSVVSLDVGICFTLNKK